MSNKDGHTKTLRFSDALDEKFGKLAQKLNRSKLQLFGLMVEYFYKTKKDPADISDEMLKTSLAKNHDIYIRFIRTQEDTLLIPLKEEVDRMINNQREIVRYFNEQVVNANKAILTGQETQASRQKETDKLLQAVYSRIDTKEKLKAKFLVILTGYIKMREELGSFKNREKDELAETFRKQITDL
ncbi:BfmA/BtgA family mobilization protein [Mucilaginibacter sp. CAU 1740]|uniref:BfmA/BtgA family mobilization protein n=1 Tax=Mucilaginibacter sp. CAU 1740 TaxID=3140365 RepID=UPI00325A4FEF